MSAKVLLTSILLLQGIAVSAQNLAGLQLQVFVDPGCDQGGNYTYFSLGSGYPDCTQNTFGGLGFQQVGSEYNATFLIPDPGEGCQIFIRAPSNVDNPQCGQVIHTFTEPECRTVVFPDPVDLNFCCGTDDCNAAIPVGSSSDKLKRSEAKNGKLRNRNVFSKKDTGNCAWAGNEPYTTDGQAQAVADNINCSDAQSCSEMFQGQVTTGSTQSFGISESVEAGLFDVVQTTTTFSYDYSYMESTSVSMTYSYTINPGSSGDLTWTPTLQCTDGQFSGSDCDGSGIPTATAGTACIPVHLGNVASGAPQGTFNFDYIN